MSRYETPGRESDAGPCERTPVEEDDCDAAYDSWAEDLEDRE